MCQGHALCNAAAPELFTLDADGYSDVDVRDVPPGMEDAVRRGMLACPERAITIEDGAPPEQPHG
jgi:ferredoxin